MDIYLKQAMQTIDQPITITECKPIGSGARYKVRLSDREEPLYVTDELVYRHRLKSGIVITAAQKEQLETEAELAECDRVIARLLGIREHSVGQLKAKLHQRQFGQEAIRTQVQKYVDRGLLDDANYAYKQAQTFLETNPAGKNFLIGWLRKKHIAREIAEETADMLLGERDEVELAVASLERKWASIRQFDLERAKSKAYTYLSRRGIGYSAAKAAFEQLYNRDKNES